MTMSAMMEAVPSMHCKKEVFGFKGWSPKVRNFSCFVAMGHGIFDVGDQVELITIEVDKISQYTELLNDLPRQVSPSHVQVM